VVRSNGDTVVLDCGLHPKKEGLEAKPRLELLEDAPLAALVSHAHVDHCGALPLLLKQWPSTQCYTTEPTLDIMDRMLHNSVSVMGTLSLERGIKDYPLYSHRDVDDAVRRAYGLPFERTFSLAAGSPIRASFHHSGHVLGSGSILLEMPGHNMLYTGDVCVRDQELLAGFNLRSLNGREGIDTLVVESTRGAHPDEAGAFEDEIERFAVEVKKVIKEGGVALVPCFALGRTQELLNVISRLVRNGKLPSVPVYASGLGRAVYEVYAKHKRYLKPDADLRPLDEFRRIGDVWERSVRRELLQRPCIIVATSGMMVENTPSAMLSQDIVRNPKNGIFFVGYLDPDTLGYKLLNAEIGDELTFEVSGHPVRIDLANRQRFHFSAHANRDDLAWLVGQLRPRNVIFVHGDEDAVQWMVENCDGEFDRFVPKEQEELLVEA
jgi:Cft2 family RNA processing exonuclease